MEISLETIQNLAPDQSSLSAAKKLLKPAKWPVRGKAAAVNSIWGQCQGSGANPYFTMADVVDHGYKCTCPSRKFPCKHVLALMWQFADNPADFVEGDPPEWVNDWLGRRRKSDSSASNSAVTKPNANKNIQLASEEQAPELSPEEIAKKEAAKAKRAEQVKAATEASIRDGLTEFQQWVNDQLRTGMGTFIKEVSERCRQIAARLVDAKAVNFASRLDELPAKVLNLNTEHQPAMAFKELGQLVLLSEAWLSNPDDEDARRAVGATESRDQLLSNVDVLRVSGIWESVGEKIETRRDGLVSHANWLLNLDEQASQRFALLQDYYPASLGRRDSGARLGSQMSAELVFYPSRSPLRAIIAKQEVQVPQSLKWPVLSETLSLCFARLLHALPWAESCPFLLAEGRVLSDRKGKFWWRDQSGALPLANDQLSPLLLGSELHSAFVVWNGEQAELFSAQTEQWGAIAC